MSKEYTVISPDIDPGHGHTRTLIDELARSFREGSCEGGEEIAAVVALLSDENILPTIAFLPKQGGPIETLSRAFAQFLLEGTREPSSFARRFASDQRGKNLSFFIGGLGSATGALSAALLAAGATGGEVITASVNFLGVANSIMMAGAKPRFADIDPSTWCMDPTSVERVLSKKTKAIILTHFNRLVDIEPLYDLLSRRGLEIPLLQDASLAVGSTCQGLRPGLINVGPGGATVMSLATSKTITGLGGAIVATNDSAVLRRILSIAYQGMNFEDPRVLGGHGANIKMNDLNAAIALVRLGKREAIFEKRRQLKALYDECLAPLVKEGRIVLQDVGDEAVVTHYAVLLKDRDAISGKLYEKHRVQLGMWPSLHLQEIYSGCGGTLPVSASLADRLTFLPFHTKLEDDDVRSLCRALKTVLKNH
jgi:dTDP-4-amino-4,6-dideoxygalactose transaminase